MVKRNESESCSVVSNSLRPHSLYSPWNSSGQNTGVGSLSLLQGIFPTQGSNPGLPHCRQILYQLRHKRNPVNMVETTKFYTFQVMMVNGFSLYMYIYLYYIFLYLCIIYVYIFRIYIYTHTVSPWRLYMNLQDVTFKDVNVCSHAHHTNNFTCLMLASSTSCCAFVSFAVQHWVEHSLQCLYFKPRMSRSKHKSSNDVVCTSRKHLRLYCTTLLFQVLHCKIFKVFFCIF